MRVFAVWQSILQSDWSKPGPGILGRMKDTRVRQFWDPKNVFPKLLGQKLKADARHPQPSCCYADDETPWDLVAVYPAGARWDGQLPDAVFIDGPVVRVRAGLQKALEQSGKRGEAKAH